MQLHEVLEPWHTIGIDIMGPFPATARQKRFLLVIVDYFTRWIEVFPMRVTTSTEIADLLINQVFARYGLPRYILSDNGPQFVSNLFNEFCRILKIKRKFTANYHPQTNMTECVNRTLKPLVAIFAQDHPHSWDKKIQQLAFAIRTSINETTGDTPAFLMFGRDPRTPLDLIIGDSIQGPPTTTTEPDHIRNYRNYLMKNINVAFNIVKEHSEVAKLSQKMKYDKHTKQREFVEGDLVWVETVAAQIGDNSIRSKLQPKYQGPCRIMKKLAASTFIVKRISDDVNLGATNIDRLKRYYEPISNPIDQPATQNNSVGITLPQTTSNSNNQVITRLPSNRQRRAPVRFSSSQY
jgi:Integrase core domain